MLVLLYRLFQLTYYQCELQYLAMFICLLEIWSYSMGSFNRPAINVNSNILPSSFASFNSGPILWALSIDLLSVRTLMSCHLHLFASLLVLFCGLFEWTRYQCELQSLATFICFLECWPYSMGSFNPPLMYVNSNIFPSSIVCLNAGPVLWALSMDLLSM